MPKFFSDWASYNYVIVYLFLLEIHHIWFDFTNKDSFIFKAKMIFSRWSLLKMFQFLKTSEKAIALHHNYDDGVR